MEWNLTYEREMWSAICSPQGLIDAEGSRFTHPDSLYWFVAMAWGAEWYIRNTGAQRWFVEDVQKPYLQWLQSQILEWKVSRRAGNAVLWQVGIVLPRGFGKTVTSTKAALLWSHLDEPNMSSYIGSEIHELAMKIYDPIRSVLMGQNPDSWFAWLYGTWRVPDRKWDDEQLVHAFRRSTALSEPSIGTFGVDRGITGHHPLQVWWDDPLSANKLRSTGTWLESVIKAVDASFAAVRTDGFMAFVLTRYLMKDVMGTALDEDGILSWNGMPSTDSRYKPSQKGHWRIYFMQARDTRDTDVYARGRPTLPTVWSDDRLTRWEDKDPDDYACQAMNDPTTGEHMPLTREQIDSLYISREAMKNIPIEYATIHVDTAFKEDQQGKGDYNVISVWLHDMRNNGMVYFDRGISSNQWRVEQFNDELVAIVLELKRRRIRVRMITDEPEPGGKLGSWKALIQQALRGAGVGRSIEIKQIPRQGTRKLMRIKTAAGYWAEGYARLVCDFDPEGKPLLNTTPGLTQLREEMLFIGKSPHDDHADAAADVWREGIWRPPLFLSETENVGQVPLQPGDSVLKDFGRKPSVQEVRDIYDEQYPQWAPDTGMPERY